MKKTNIRLLWLVPALALLIPANMLLANDPGEVLTCKQILDKREHRCVVAHNMDEDFIEKKDQVILYSPGERYWVATGEVMVVRGKYLVATFKDSDPRLYKGLEVVIESRENQETLNWSLAFSKLDQLSP